MISAFYRTSTVLLAGVGFTSALNIRALDLTNPLSSTGLSSVCQSTLLDISSNPEASLCLNTPGLAAILTLQPNSSAIPALNTWLEGVCAADPCSNSTINAIVSNVTSGCQSDIANTNVSQGVLQSIIQQLPLFYPTVRSIACLKTASNDTLCATSTLLDVQQFEGVPITIDSAMNVISQLVNASQSSQLPASLTCTGCTQAAFETFQTDQAMLAANPTVQSVISSQCGSGFLNGSQSSDVVAGTGAASPTGTVVAFAARNGAGGSLLGAMLSFKTMSFVTVVAGLFLIAA
ncbi:hypothetical protein BU17DRAFT_100476 [Hysterangium stoloniferum]|nr:hypothetical protein BU17DRAFT_100476 [Hysterangium stoloniferum]